MLIYYKHGAKLLKIIQTEYFLRWFFTIWNVFSLKCTRESMLFDEKFVLLHGTNIIYHIGK